MNNDQEKDVEPLNDGSAGKALNRTVNSGASRAEDDADNGTSDTSGGYANLEQEVKDAADALNEQETN